jgi:hypothetical protein
LDGGKVSGKKSKSSNITLTLAPIQRICCVNLAFFKKPFNSPNPPLTPPIGGGLVAGKEAYKKATSAYFFCFWSLVSKPMVWKPKTNWCLFFYQHNPEGFGFKVLQHNPFGFLAKLLAPIGARPKAKQGCKTSASLANWC